MILGITGTEMTPDIAAQVNVPISIIADGQGFLVIDVLRNGSIENADKRGDTYHQ